jgi:hypothetical protein
VLKRFVPVVVFCAALLAVAGCSSPGGSPAAPGANPPAKGKAGATGCGLVSAAEVSQLTGVTFKTGISVGPVKVNPTALQPVAVTESCSYKISDQVYVDYIINTLTESAAAYEPKVWKDDMTEEESATEFTVDGLPALGVPEEGENGRTEQVVFYKGSIVVEVNTGGVPDGDSVSVADLLGKRVF